jgi:predicted RecA/RadA family phage recombinase|nr:MAG TPA: protein of unknown function DUF2190 [Caudoviricetes sp.]
MAENLRSDGKAVDVTLGNAFNNVTVNKGDLIQAEGWVGVAMHNGTKGDKIAIETTQREFVFPVGNIAAAKGAVLYADLANDGKLTLVVDKTKTPIIKVTRAKDSNNNVWAKLLPQTV